MQRPPSWRARSGRFTVIALAAFAAACTAHGTAAQNPFEAAMREAVATLPGPYRQVADAAFAEAAGTMQPSAAPSAATPRPMRGTRAAQLQAEIDRMSNQPAVLPLSQSAELQRRQADSRAQNQAWRACADSGGLWANGRCEMTGAELQAHRDAQRVAAARSACHTDGGAWSEATAVCTLSAEAEARRRARTRAEGERTLAGMQRALEVFMAVDETPPTPVDETTLEMMHRHQDQYRIPGAH